jgi:hypothetical protein
VANALITVLVHCREVVEKVDKAQLKKAKSFLWLSQMRWKRSREDVSDIEVEQCNYRFK